MDKKYYSERGHELVARVPNVITCENYVKWYNLYYIDSNENVHILEHLYPDAYDIEFLDHSWEPASLVKFAIKHDLKIGEKSYEAMLNMYAESISSDYVGDKHLPVYNDYCKIIVPDNGNFDNCNFVIFDNGVSSNYKLYQK